ncbi:MAG: PAS domain-containing sensor histidine kinase [Candidatus Tokpelaia sp.]|nr:MAG: PAS domain-containing sensor histidine kinase [Candidatus Tokpelaia sp.]KAA6207846.1 MAG: PAS domain-containing sensor histidine kinase [Candidatus Tokpelaia sp.]
MQPQNKKSALGENPHRLRAFVGLAVIILALLSAVLSFFILMGLTPIMPDRAVTRLLTYINAFMVLCLITGIGAALYPIIKSRRARRAASRLHVRLIALFSLAAAVPALAIAIVAGFTLNIGLDRWFDVNTRQIVASSVNLANAYAGATLQSLQAASYTMGRQLDNRQLLTLNRPEYSRQLTLQAIGRDLLGVFLLKKDGSVIISSERGDEKNLPIPPQSWIKEATLDNPVTFQPGAHGYFGVILKMDDIDEAWLYAVRETDPRVLEALRLTEANTNYYRELEANRVPTQIVFSVLYFCLFLIMLLSAIWAGIAVADRLVRPIRRLIDAADNVAGGNLAVQVPVHVRDGDIGQLARTFNYMVGELNSQRNELIAAGRQIDERRRFSEAVLSGVSAAVIGVDEEGFITIINRSAEHMFNLSGQAPMGKSLMAVSAAIGNVFEIARARDKNIYGEQITVKERNGSRVYNVRITMENSDRVRHSWVVTIDDITDLAEAQRSSAWADVARRIAHEIKNPLTPIQLSAERIRRRFGGHIEDKDKEIFDRCVETIIRQVGDIGRMVDEFSSFARMPRPQLEYMDIRGALSEAFFLIEVSRPDIIFERELAPAPLFGAFDEQLAGRAFGNLIKNASEAIDAGLAEAAALGRTGDKGHIKLRARQKGDKIIVDIMDNGKGLPKKERQKLLEPYITMREKGTGLGLAIVRKIVEEHSGRMELLDAPADFYQGRGAMIRLIFPFIAPVAESEDRGEESSVRAV